MPSTNEVLERPPVPMARAVVLLLAVLAALALGWSCLARMDIVVSGTGTVVPRGRVKLVQPLEAGVITEIVVREGEQVHKGDLLVRMDATESMADLHRLARELSIVRLTVSRISAQLAGDPELFMGSEDDDPEEIALQRRLLLQALETWQEKIKAMKQDISRTEAELESTRLRAEWLEKSLPLAEKLYAKKRAMAKKKMMASGQFLQARIEINEARKNLELARGQLREQELRLAAIREEKRLTESQYRQNLLTELAEMRKKQETLIQQKAKAKKRMENRELRSPVDGIVQQLTINTVGGVVTAAQPLMTIVPTDAGLEIEARILNKDIGSVREGQKVSVKVAAFPYTRHGDLSGVIEWVGRDAVMDKQMGPIYPVRISLTDTVMPNAVHGRRGTILPGMTVTTDIKVGRRRVIHYFLGPILRYRDQSLKEL